jgi:hypothetical protein
MDRCATQLNLQLPQPFSNHTFVRSEQGMHATFTCCACVLTVDIASHFAALHEMVRPIGFQPLLRLCCQVLLLCVVLTAMPTSHNLALNARARLHSPRAGHVVCRHDQGVRRSVRPLRCADRRRRAARDAQGGPDQKGTHDSAAAAAHTPVSLVVAWSDACPHERPSETMQR